MRTALARVRDTYGAHPLHLLGLLACFALVGYTVVALGPAALWNTDVWWQSIIVWFLGAVIAHDLVLFPVYAIADRPLRSRQPTTPPAVPGLNYLRVPTLASALLFLLFFPGIIEQGQDTYAAATGQTQDPYLERWLLLTGSFFAISAVAYAARLRLTRPCPPRTIDMDGPPVADPDQ